VTSRLRSWVRALLGRRQFEDGLAEEMRQHLELYANDLVQQGLSRDDAMRRARIEFGNLDNVTLDCRQARGLRGIDELQQHLRYAIRLLRKSPGFTFTALATLALCLGVNLAIFAVVDAILIRPLPFPDADRLVLLYNTYPKAGVPDDGSSVANYYERRGQIKALENLALYRDDAAIVGKTGSTEREYVTRVTPEFFQTLGINPALGRAFTDAELTYQTSDVVIITDTYWREHLAADPQVIGQTIRMDGSPVTIVGVLPAGFSFLSSTRNLYLPLASDPRQRQPNQRHSGSSSHMVARLRAGASVLEAQSQIDAHNAAMERTNPEAQFIADAGFRSIVAPLHAAEVAEVRPTLLLLQAGVLFLLFIGVVNVMNLLLIRASGRLRELAVRQAIGAGRRHVVMEVLVETTLLTTVGGILGLGLGAAGIQLLTLLGTDRLPLGARIAFDLRAAVVALSSAVAIGIAIGGLIAWYSLRAHATTTLTAETRTSTTSRAAQRMRHAFLVAQVALAFVLLAGASLLALSLRQVLAVSPGFRSESVLTGQVALPWNRYPDGARRQAFVDRLIEELRRQPGAIAAGVATNIPFSGNSNKSSATIKGRPWLPGQTPHAVYTYAVGGEYFAAMGIPLERGRFLAPSDGHATSLACVVDADFARYFFPRGDALGQRIFLGSQEGPDSEAYTVVGIVGPVKQAGLADENALGAVYYPYNERFDNNIFVVARTTVPPESLAQTMQRVVRGIDAELPVNNLRAMQTRIDRSLMSRRSPAMLAAGFAAIALLLTALGTYGLLSYAVTQRRREIALRMALGAGPGQVRSQFVRLAARLLIAGVALGLVGAWMTGRAMRGVLFHVPPVDARVLGLTALVMAVVCLLACLLPSQRAARISPSEALSEL
jgi:putative ABC transport system permease protein